MEKLASRIHHNIGDCDKLTRPRQEENQKSLCTEQSEQFEWFLHIFYARTFYKG